MQNENRSNFKGKIHFDFDLKVSWILANPKEKKIRGNNFNIFKLLGFKFMVDDYFEEFHATDDIILQEIKELFRKKLNQNNFHDYYRAIKKIGKGNFASVN